MLLSINIPHQLTSLILSCISSSSLAILVNGNSTNIFKPSRGFRQGDSMPPYLFILGMEYLSLLIHRQVSSGNWKPIWITNLGPTISHTLFADGVFLFEEATLENANTINSILQTFASYSWLSINKHKSKLFFSNSCSSNLCEEINQILNISKTSDLGKYLGFPLLKRKLVHFDFQPIINNIFAKLTSWKAKMLNLVGRITLAKYVLFSIPIHIMQCFPLPKKTTNAININILGYLWGSSEENKKLHLIK